MKQLQIVFLPLGRVNFHMESAGEVLENSKKMLGEIYSHMEMPEELITSPEMLREYLVNLEEPDLIIFQNTTFVDSTFAAEVVRNIKCPILLWTVREPFIDGGRLRLNSLTGAFSAGNLFTSQGRSYEYIFSAPGEEKVAGKIKSVIDACRVKKSLRELTVGVVGTAPGGFYFSTALDTELLKLTGSKIESIEARDIIKRAKELDKEQYEQHISELCGTLKEADKIPPDNLEKYGRLYAAYSQFIEEKGIKALASRCWPDFFTEYATPVCGVLSTLTDRDIVAACEADVYGAVSMYILKELTGAAPYFGDPVSLDEGKNTITFWHCGAGACSLARKDTGARVGVHPNRKIGPTMEFGLKSGRVTVIRLGRKADGTFRIFLMGGEAADEPQQFLGTSVVVKTDNDAGKIIADAVQAGWEPHFVLGYGDVSEAVKSLGRLLQIEVIEY
ncbi:L-fucose/L-arabinose isomerase family protein [Desulfitibacter alkalitolerans]|uniref:L-fucose/L-arabinose isomerase family protein n=1 Tax=Desulfitibacter alkalitolerans TaxID=264641 RepID=UPI0004894112|nr:hypothetical protein [Desulfitibacter alkalitolerans]